MYSKIVKELCEKINSSTDVFTARCECYDYLVVTPRRPIALSGRSLCDKIDGHLLSFASMLSNENKNLRCAYVDRDGSAWFFVGKEEK